MSEPKVLAYGVMYRGWMISFDTERAAQKFSAEHGDYFGLHIRKLVSARELAKWLKSGAERRAEAASTAERDVDNSGGTP